MGNGTWKGQRGKCIDVGPRAYEQGVYGPEHRDKGIGVRAYEQGCMAKGIGTCNYIIQCISCFVLVFCIFLTKIQIVTICCNSNKDEQDCQHEMLFLFGFIERPT